MVCRGFKQGGLTHGSLARGDLSPGLAYTQADDAHQDPYDTGRASHSGDTRLECVSSFGNSFRTGFKQRVHITRSVFCTL